MPAVILETFEQIENAVTELKQQQITLKKREAKFITGDIWVNIKFDNYGET